MQSIVQLKRQGDLIKSRSWQTLIILDACRYDVFADAIKHFDIKGSLIEVDSNACKTSSWYKNHWRDEQKDIVLVTGHPQVYINNYHLRFHDTVNVKGPTPEWIETDKTMEWVLIAQSDYPDKRIMTHLIPPHLPFMGEKGAAFMNELMGKSGWGEPDCHKINGTTLYQHATNYGKKFGWKRLKECYRENLFYVLSGLLPYIDKLKGPVVVTADHGELLGDNDMYNHKGGHEILRRVPWFIING